jgi:ATPase subunit of ABC transporter with duplicated ATPase domains
LWAGTPTASAAPGDTMKALARYGLAAQAEQRFETLSGGRQARLLILLLELSGATLLLLDEPTRPTTSTSHRRRHWSRPSTRSRARCRR